MDLLKKLNDLTYLDKTVKGSECAKLKLPGIDLYAKLEFQLFSGSVKIRAAYNILKDAIEKGQVNEDTTIIESSSGNFAIAMSMLCKQLGLKFVAVVDKLTNPNAKKFLDFFAYEVVVIDVRDAKGGYLLNRLAFIDNYLKTNKNVFWTNQYENENNFYAHYNGTGVEIISAVGHMDYVFIGAGTCGTLSGISSRIKDTFGDRTKVIAVDIVGSSIFDSPPKTRFIPGMGSSIKPKLLSKSRYDEVVHVDERDVIQGCYDLISEQAIFGGGSSGTVYWAIKEYFKGKTFDKPPKVVFLCPDGGRFYLDTIYNKQWVKETFDYDIPK